MDSLLEAPGIRPVAVSPVYQTTPVGGPEQDDYYNAVLVVDTDLPARTMLERCLAVEEAYGRERTKRWGPRTLDIDVVVIGDRRKDDPDFVLPHPRAHERAFVLAPWLAIDPEAEIPGRGAGPRSPGRPRHEQRHGPRGRGAAASGVTEPRALPGQVVAAGRSAPRACPRWWRSWSCAARSAGPAYGSSPRISGACPTSRCLRRSRSCSSWLCWPAAALIMRRRVQQWRPGREQVSPDLAVRLLVLAKASALAGAAVAGVYLGAAVAYADDLDVPFRRSSTWWCLGSAALALVVVAPRCGSSGSAVRRRSTATPGRAGVAQ